MPPRPTDTAGAMARGKARRGQAICPRFSLSDPPCAAGSSVLVFAPVSACALVIGLMVKKPTSAPDPAAEAGAGIAAPKAPRSPKKPAAAKRPAAKAAAVKAAGGKAARAPKAPKAATASTAGGASSPGVLKLRDLIERASDASGLSRKETRPVVEALLVTLGDALAAGDTLVLPPLGRVRVSRSKDLDNGTTLTIKLRRVRTHKTVLRSAEDLADDIE